MFFGGFDCDSRFRRLPTLTLGCGFLEPVSVDSNWKSERVMEDKSSDGDDELACVK